MVTAATQGMIENTPDLDAYVYFVLHLFIGVVHTVAVLILVTAGGRVSGLSKRTRLFGVMTHGGQLSLHVILGTVAFFNWRLRYEDGSIPWWLMVVVVMIAIGMPLYLRGAHKDIGESNLVGR